MKEIKVGPVPPEMARQLAEQQRKDEEFTRQVGHVRPPTAIEVNDYKLVTAGGRIVCMLIASGPEHHVASIEQILRASFLVSQQSGRP